MAEITDLLAMMGDFMRDADRRHAEHEERLKGHDRQITNLMESFSRQFEKMDQRFEKMDQRFEKMDQRFEKMDQRAERVEAELVKLNTQMGKVEYHLAEIDATTKHSLIENKVIVIKISSIDEAVGRIEKFQQAQEDVLRRLGVLEGVVLTPVMRRAI